MYIRIHCFWLLFSTLYRAFNTENYSGFKVHTSINGRTGPCGVQLATWLHITELLLFILLY